MYKEKIMSEFYKNSYIVSRICKIHGKENFTYRYAILYNWKWHNFTTLAKAKKWVDGNCN